jgi:hypothetical protein
MNVSTILQQISKFTNSELKESCLRGAKLSCQLIIRNPSEYINIGNINIQQLKGNTMHLKTSHMPQKIMTYVCTTTGGGICQCLSKIDIYLDDTFIPPTDFMF